MTEVKNLKYFSDMNHVFCYYYTTLDEKERKLYEKLTDGMFRYKPSITLWGATPEMVSRIYDKVMYDMPALFFQEGLQTVWYPALRCVKVIPQYRFSQADAENTLHAVMQRVQPLVDQCRGRTELECENLVHDFLYNSVTYDDNYALHMGGSSFEMIAPLLWGRGVCSGISKAAKFIFDLLGMKSLLLVGQITANPDPNPDHNKHSWNMVKIGDQRYHLDITFDITTQSRRYFNLTDQEILADRIMI